MATLLQQKAIGYIDKGDSVSKAMRKAGYSKSVANNPKKLTGTLAFAEWLEKVGITDNKLADKLNEGLESTKAVVMGTKSDESFVDIQPDYAIRHKYLETSLKLKGHLRNADPAPSVVVIPILGGASTKVIETEPEST